MSWLTTILQTTSKLFQWWVVAAPWEQGVRVRLGKRTKHLAPGIHFRIPFLDRVILVCVRERVIRTACQTLSTKDQKVLTMGLTLRYSIEDAAKMLRTVARPEESLKAIAQAQAAQIVAATRSEDLCPEMLEGQITENLDGTDWGLGSIEVHIVTFAYARTLRLLQAHDNDYSSAFDANLDQAPATLS